MAQPTIKTVKPKGQLATYVTATGDRSQGRKSKSMTVYGMTPDQVIDTLRMAIEQLATKSAAA